MSLPVIQPHHQPGTWPLETQEAWRQRIAKKGARRGYFHLPGTGPEGETCKTCRHADPQEMANRWWKCLRMRAHWTGGPATDICVTAPACKGWEPRS